MINTICIIKICDKYYILKAYTIDYSRNLIYGVSHEKVDVFTDLF